MSKLTAILAQLTADEQEADSAEVELLVLGADNDEASERARRVATARLETLQRAHMRLTTALLAEIAAENEPVPLDAPV